MRYVFYAMAMVSALYVWAHETPRGREVLRKFSTPAAGSVRAYHGD